MNLTKLSGSELLERRIAGVCLECGVTAVDNDRDSGFRRYYCALCEKAIAREIAPAKPSRRRPPTVKPPALARHGVD